MKFLTSSLAKAARSCRRKYLLRYVQGIQPIESAHALRFGTLVHRALEAWWLSKKNGLTEDEWLTAAIAITTEREVEPLDAAKARVMIVGYHTRWKDEPYEVLAVEAQFQGPLVNPKTGAHSRSWELAGKIDAIVRDTRDGRVLLVEHKTSGEDVTPGSDYWRRLRMDTQVSIYFEGGRLLGYQPDACLYDVLSKPRHELSQVPVLDEHGNKIVLDAEGQRVRTAQGKWRQTGDSKQGYVLQTRLETVEEFTERLMTEVANEPDKFFARGDVVRLNADMTSAFDDVWELAQALQYDSVKGRHPRNPDACFQYGRTCPYFAICAGEASADDQQLFKRSTDVHPELAGHVEQPKEEAQP